MRMSNGLNETDTTDSVGSAIETCVCLASVDSPYRKLSIFGASCQWPCSGDQTLPRGAGPGGWGVSLVGVCGSRISGSVVGASVESVAAVGVSCQWACSGDQTLPRGAGPGWPGRKPGGGVSSEKNIYTATIPKASNPANASMLRFPVLD